MNPATTSAVGSAGPPGSRGPARGAPWRAGATARRWAGNEDAERLHHEEMANRVADVLGEMKGAAMKLGQLLSFIDLDLPPEVRSVYHDALARLRDDAPPVDPDAIERVVLEDFGAPVEEVFASWERQPLAAASIGQVHAAKLHDGREVVAKVQYPGVADAVRSDLSNAEMFAPLARWFSPNQELEPLLDELRERIDDELDYEREAQYQRAFADRYADHPFIVVPDVVGDLCRNRVLVSERIHGRRFDEVASGGDDALRQRVGEIIFRYAFGSIARFRLFNGDPHPGNYLVTDDDRVAFLDYGSVKMFTRERYASMRRVDDAVSARRREGFLDAMRETRFLPPRAGIDEDMLWAWVRLYTRPIIAEQPFCFTSEFATEVLRTTSLTHGRSTTACCAASTCPRTTCCSPGSTSGSTRSGAGSRPATTGERSTRSSPRAPRPPPRSASRTRPGGGSTTRPNDHASHALDAAVDVGDDPAVLLADHVRLDRLLLGQLDADLEVLGQDAEGPHRLGLGHGLVGVVDGLLDLGAQVLVVEQLTDVGGLALRLGPWHHGLGVDRDQGSDEGFAVAHDHGLADQEVGADAVLEHGRGDVLAAGGDDELLLAPRDPQEAVVVEAGRCRRCGTSCCCPAPRPWRRRCCSSP